MRIIAKKILREFWEIHPDVEQQLKAWYQEASKAEWMNPNVIKREYSSASFLAQNRVVFNIRGNNYRLIVKINYDYQIIWIRLKKEDIARTDSFLHAAFLTSLKSTKFKMPFDPGKLAPDQIAASEVLLASALASAKKRIPQVAVAGLATNSSQTLSPQDTARTRIVLAYHQVKIFKSDLQAKSDSAFFSYADSTIRCYFNPMVWSQGSQLSGDTIYLQLKNKKLDNMLIQNKGFIVNTEADSSKYNQIKGKLLTGYFLNNKLDRMFADGNAESIYYAKEDTGYAGMNHSVSSRMKVLFKDGQLKDVVFIRKPEMTFYPMPKITKDTEVLQGFIWKPKERPKSKEEIIPALADKNKDIVLPVIKPKVTPKSSTKNNKPAVVKRKPE